MSWWNWTFGIVGGISQEKWSKENDDLSLYSVSHPERSQLILQAAQ